MSTIFVCYWLSIPNHHHHPWLGLGRAFWRRCFLGERHSCLFDKLITQLIVFYFCFLPHTRTCSVESQQLQQWLGRVQRVEDCVGWLWKDQFDIERRGLILNASEGANVHNCRRRRHRWRKYQKTKANIQLTNRADLQHAFESIDAKFGEWTVLL